MHTISDLFLSVRYSKVIILLILIVQPVALWAAEQSTALDLAQFSAGRLVKPANLDQWIHLGSNMGQSYNEALFDPDKPGTFHIVEMEPTAYTYFKQHGGYADGTMIALSFYRATSKTNPRLNGYSQGELVGFEIHLIDRQRYEEGRAFFNFRLNDEAEMIPAGNRCVACHREEGAFDGTFSQFYPKLKNIIKLHQQ